MGQNQSVNYYGSCACTAERICTECRAEEAAAAAERDKKREKQRKEAGASGKNTCGQHIVGCDYSVSPL